MLGRGGCRGCLAVFGWWLGRRCQAWVHLEKDAEVVQYCDCLEMMESGVAARLSRLGCMGCETLSEPW